MCNIYNKIGKIARERRYERAKETGKVAAQALIRRVMVPLSVFPPRDFVATARDDILR